MRINKYYELNYNFFENIFYSQILELVCDKHGFNPQEYALFRNNKQLDLSLTIRFANIPNNGQLDLKPAAVQRKEEKVTVAIDLESGERKIEEFDSNQNLWIIIHHLFNNSIILNQSPDMNFCIVYMRKEIEGEVALKQTSLRSLGLTKGKVAMRLLVRPKNASKEQAHVESLNLKRTSDPKELSLAVEETVSNKVNALSTESTSVQKLSTLPVKPENVKTPELDSNLESENTRSNVISTEIAKSVNEETNSDESHQNETQQIDVNDTDSSDETNDVLNFLGGNNSEVVFKLSDVPKLSNVNISDDVFELTKEDLKYLISDLRRQQVGTSEDVLLTKQLREQREREKMNKYKSTVLRICFPYDRLVLQAIFKPNDNVRHVMEVVKRYIKENTTDFYLYTAPPKQLLEPNSTLFELNLVPAALIHFGFKSSTGKSVLKEELRDQVTGYKAAAKLALNTRKETNDSPVLGLPQVSDKLDANQTVRQDLQTASGSGNQRIPDSGINRAQNVTQSAKDGKIPKWFKTNK